MSEMSKEAKAFFKMVRDKFPFKNMGRVIEISDEARKKHEEQKKIVARRYGKDSE